jgi:methylmalonyl-CoA mutase
MTDTHEKRFPEFPEVTTSQWEAQIIKDLKGKEYEKTLVWRTNEGFSVRPYYRTENLEGKEYLNAAPGTFPFVRGNCTENNWLIRQDIMVENLQEANKKALYVLGKGVNSIGFVFENCSNLNSDDLKVLLKDICPEAAEINLVCACSDDNLLKACIAFFDESTWGKKDIKGSVTHDPLSELLLKGKSDGCCDHKHFYRFMDKIALAESFPGLKIIAVNGKSFGNSGSTVVQELAFSLSIGVEYIGQLTGLGLKPDEVAKRIIFNLSIGNNYFFEIAKLRAGRLLWSRIVKAYGTEDDDSARMIVHSETGTFNKTIYDPWVNLLRTQTEAMSAALGGAYSVTVLPFDAVFRQPGEFSERIARNQQILLKEESNLDKITDAAGGSYYLESLTEAIAEHAWKLFMEVEEKGGFLAAIKEGFIQKIIADTAAKRIQNISSRRENVLGVNQFPNFSEVISEQLDESVFRPVDFTAENAEWDTLKPLRGAQTLEALRYRTDNYAKEHKRPAAFMLTIGDLAMRKARALFSCNFFAVGGFEVIDNNGFDTLEEGISAARATHADIIVICSSDEEYATLVPVLKGMIGNEILAVAGNPACRPDLEAIGVKNFIHIRSNLIEELKKYQELLNI